jgi:hypothetical protein
MAPVVALPNSRDRRARHRTAWTKHLLLTLRTALGEWQEGKDNGWEELEPLWLRLATLKVWRDLTTIIEALDDEESLEIVRAASNALFDDLGLFANQLESVINTARATPGGEANPTH